MDELVKAMKVIKLKDQESGQYYLTAGDNMVSVTLTTPNTKGWNPKNTEWRLEWLNDPKGLAGQVRLWSVYNKVLTFAPDPNAVGPLYDALTQESWPVVTGAYSAEWRFELSSRNNNATLVGDLIKRFRILRVSLSDPEKGPRLVMDYCFNRPRFKWLNIGSWVVEVVVSPLEMAKDEVNHHQPKCPIGQTQSFNICTKPGEIIDKDINDQYQSKCSLGLDTKLNSSVKQKTPIPQEQPPIQRQVSSNATSITKSNTSTRIPTHTPSREMYKDIDRYPSSPATADGQPVMQRQVNANATRSGGIGLLHDHAMSTLSRWQVGQVYLHVSPTPTGVHTSAGYNYNQYYNSGRNVNGSGNQKNGDVTVRSDINRSRDNNANFLNYEYA